MIGSDTYNVVNMPSAQVCVTLPSLCEMVGRTAERLVRKAHLEIILHEITNNYNE